MGSTFILGGGSGRQGPQGPQIRSDSKVSEAQAAELPSSPSSGFGLGRKRDWGPSTKYSCIRSIISRNPPCVRRPQADGAGVWKTQFGSYVTWLPLTDTPGEEDQALLRRLPRAAGVVYRENRSTPATAPSPIYPPAAAPPRRHSP